jgi:crotonobetaine/carnitine-CoA ligase
MRSVTTATASACVLRYALEHWTARQPDRVFAVFEDGEQWSYEETLARTRRLAAALQSLGLAQGDHVVVWLPNSKEALLAYFAVNYIGGVYVPINTAYRGPLLAHVIGNSDARVILAHGTLAARLEDVDRARLETLVVVGGVPPAIEGMRILDFEAIQRTTGEPSEPPVPIEPWHTQSIIYTSGTTGPSKGVLSSYLHAYASMNDEAWYCVGPEDRFLVNMPFFHIGGSFIVYSMLCRGASIALTEGFRTDRFWQVARETDSTVVFLLGAMAAFLQKEPPAATDSEHPLSTVFIVPFTEDAVQFADRFRVDVYTIFNMTEVSTPIISEANPKTGGYCGKARTGFELRVVDDNDNEVPDGEVGELILRADRPWTLNHGYYKNPEATATAWRNGWFHTGDFLRRDSEGGYHFVDRKKDAIRRRGENISSAEVEAVVIEHEAVQECAAIAVPSEWGEDEVMVILALKAGRELAPERLLDYLLPRMAHFMVPRYLRFLAELPKTPTTKIQKSELRRQGVTEDTWDREAAGIEIKTERLA